MDIDEFLKNWNPSKLLEYATLDHNINDPFIHLRLLSDFTGEGNVIRSKYSSGQKRIDHDEATAIDINFWETNSKSWSEDFCSRSQEAGISRKKIQLYFEFLNKFWADGMSKRTKSKEIASIELSILNYYNTHQFPLYVDEYPDKNCDPLFRPEEVDSIFSINSDILGYVIDDYIEKISDIWNFASDDIWLRRGMFIDKSLINNDPFKLRERRFITSYSFSITVAEQFSQTYSHANKIDGVPIIVSIPLSECMNRIIAFSPFVPGFPKNQMEIILAPPRNETLVADQGPHGAVFERVFSRNINFFRT